MICVSIISVNSPEIRLYPSLICPLTLQKENVLSINATTKKSINLFYHYCEFCVTLWKQLSDKPRLPALSFLLSVLLSVSHYHNHSATPSIKCEGLMLSAIYLLTALYSFSTISCLGFLFFFFFPSFLSLCV